MFLKIYFTALGIFLAIDAIWLGFIAKNFYQKYIGTLMKTNINWVSGFLVYALFILGLVILVLIPGMKTKTFLQVAMLGGLFGLASYGVYDLTNLATLKNWPLIVTVIDMIWGFSVGFLVSLFTYLITINVFKI